jgi:hypothetical protein
MCSAPAAMWKSPAVSRANVENAVPCDFRHIEQWQ